MSKHIRHTCSLIAHLALLSCLALSTSLHAEADEADPLVKFSGFGTVGVVHNQGDGSVFIRDLTQQNGASNRGVFWEVDSRVGVQANFKPAENFEAVAQIISRYRTENSFKPELTWGFLRYSPSDIVDMRAGRVGFDVFLGADSRDVGYSYVWVRPPVDYYGQLFNSYLDGGDIAVRAPLGDGTGRIKLYSGLVRQQFASARNQRNYAGNVTFAGGAVADLHESRITGGVVDYQDNHWTVRLARADLKLRVTFSFDTPQPDIASLLRATAISSPAALANSMITLADGLEANGKHVVFTSLGVAYENGPLQTQAALNRFTSEFLPFVPSNSGFLSVGYRYGKFTPYAVISAIKSETSRRPDELSRLGANPLIVDGVKYILNTGQRIQNTYSLGMRYDFAHHAALKFQVDKIHSKTCSPVSLPFMSPSPPCPAPFLWPSVPVSWDGRATVYSAVLDFTF